MVYILARDYRTASRIATRRHLVKTEWRYITSTRDLLGTDKATVWAVEGWKQRVDYFQLEAMLRDRKCQVHEVGL